jgi:hypothetical protein
MLIRTLEALGNKAPDSKKMTSRKIFKWPQAVNDPCHPIKHLLLITGALLQDPVDHLIQIADGAFHDCVKHGRFPGSYTQERPHPVSARDAQAGRNGENLIQQSEMNLRALRGFDLSRRVDQSIRPRAVQSTPPPAPGGSPSRPAHPSHPPRKWNAP